MKKILALVLVAAFSLATASAMACPKGEVMTGGTGKHHKGGACAPKAEKSATNAAAPAAEPAKK